jgi:hypothetical protein
MDMKRKKKSKPVQIKIIPRDEKPELYDLMNELISNHHHHLIDANIAIAWRYGWKEDQDGRTKLGQAKKLSDLDRELRTEDGKEIDLVILLNFEAWNRADFKEKHQSALIDHELCHFQVAVDEDGEFKLDSRGRAVYRIRGHDVEEFTEIVSRHGIWKNDLEKFARVTVEAAGLFDETKMKLAQ